MITVSVVTPSYNSRKYIKETLLSVLKQEGNFLIEHIVVDGKSNDGTIQELKNFEIKVNNGELKYKCKGYTFKWISEKDSGMYNAILKGFAKCTGDIMAWINADDLYQPGCFNLVAGYFEKNPKVLWIKGIGDYIERNKSMRKGVFFVYKKKLIKMGVYGTIGRFIQQDSVFWKRELWESVNHNELRQYKLAGDFRLWQLFAEKTKMYSIPAHVSYFRKRDGQLSSNMDLYMKEANRTVGLSSLERRFYTVLFRIDRFFNYFINKYFINRK